MTRNPFVLRTVAYSLLLVGAVSETILPIMYIIFPEDGASPIPSILTFSVAGGTLIWSCVLLATNNKPSSSHPLCTALAHIIALCISTMVWLAVAIAVSTTLMQACSSHYNIFVAGFCALGIIVSLLGYLMSLLSAGTALLIYLKSSERGGLRKSVAFTDIGYDGQL